MPNLRQTTQDGGTALAKGLALVNQERRAAGQATVVAQDDHFHVLREGTRALRRMQGNVSRLMDQATAADRQAANKARARGLPGQWAAAAPGDGPSVPWMPGLAAEQTWAEVGVGLAAVHREGA